MQITPVAPIAMPSAIAPMSPPQAPPASRNAIELDRAAGMLPADDTTAVPSPDAPEAVRSGFIRYARLAKSLRSIPGISSSGWRSSQPDRIAVYSDGPGWSQLFRNVVREQVDGMSLALVERSDDGSGVLPPNGSTPFWDKLQMQLGAVSALPGVSDWTLDGAAVPGDPYTFIRFTVTSAERGAELAGFVREQLLGLPVRFAVG